MHVYISPSLFSFFPFFFLWFSVFYIQKISFVHENQLKFSYMYWLHLGKKTITSSSFVYVQMHPCTLNNFFFFFLSCSCDLLSGISRKFLSSMRVNWNSHIYTSYTCTRRRSHLLLLFSSNCNHVPSITFSLFFFLFFLLSPSSDVCMCIYNESFIFHKI